MLKVIIIDQFGIICQLKIIEGYSIALINDTQMIMLIERAFAHVR